MKQNKFLLLFAFTMVATITLAHGKTDSVKVHGNCEMCKNRIEKAVSKMEGVSKADWNVDTKVLTVTYDTHNTNMDEIQKSIAAVGHDTEKSTADDAVYNKLPGCCKYERKAKTSGSHDGHKH